MSTTDARLEALEKDMDRILIPPNPIKQVKTKILTWRGTIASIRADARKDRAMLVQPHLYPQAMSTLPEIEAEVSAFSAHWREGADMATKHGAQWWTSPDVIFLRATELDALAAAIRKERMECAALLRPLAGLLPGGHREALYEVIRRLEGAVPKGDGVREGATVTEELLHCPACAFNFNVPDNHPSTCDGIKPKAWLTPEDVKTLLTILDEAEEYIDEDNLKGEADSFFEWMHPRLKAVIANLGGIEP